MSLLNLFTMYDDLTYTSYPQVYTTTEKDHIEMQVVVPAFSKDELDVSVVGRVLDVKSVNKEEKNSLFTGVKRQFTKKYRLGSEIDIGSIESHLENGVLYIKLPLKDKEIKRVAIE